MNLENSVHPAGEEGKKRLISRFNAKIVHFVQGKPKHFTMQVKMNASY